MDVRHNSHWVATIQDLVSSDGKVVDEANTKDPFPLHNKNELHNLDIFDHLDRSWAGHNRPDLFPSSLEL